MRHGDCECPHQAPGSRCFVRVPDGSNPSAQVGMVARYTNGNSDQWTTVSSWILTR
jgi:hypothetical protein